ncbi:Uracil phosphoribosyltransferase [Taphrina deformans PYCC 5710]|uniref:uracil phosphoribosyltransferase n=1 Tax=Taphrina deformans (strain PYCC 5710 / ATCC 11124 / CBS 356.35 / IMI 108563 / JCM 9778 / NBRC 8474) TaxID=1097556 RepID=R4XAZ4_TAPDE|nr:Uracil phosphoribosyltransferase [Taphrina deformans PYCC 5710]|eukprot:CCG81498.1 Uracil phosphoribosyltransferase [Taphrina deformans PYCC 5710]
MSVSPVSVSTHPVVISKISELRSTENNAKTVRLLISEISTLLAYEATNKSLQVESLVKSETPIGASYDLQSITPTRLCLVPVLRSGLGMTESFLSLLPSTTEVHHLGLFREENTLSAVEYYNKLPHPKESGHIDTAFIVDPIIATGNTACAAIQIMKEWGVKKIVFTCVLASRAGIERVSKEWPAGVSLIVGCVDDKLNEKGYIVPGVGDVGDRLNETGY